MAVPEAVVHQQPLVELVAPVHSVAMVVPALQLEELQAVFQAEAAVPELPAMAAMAPEVKFAFTFGDLYELRSH